MGRRGCKAAVYANTVLFFGYMLAAWGCTLKILWNAHLWIINFSMSILHFYKKFTLKQMLPQFVTLNNSYDCWICVHIQTHTCLDLTCMRQNANYLHWQWMDIGLLALETVLLFRNMFNKFKIFKRLNKNSALIE